MLKTRDWGPPPPPSRPEFIVDIWAGTCTHVAQHRDKTVLRCGVDSQKIEQVPRSSMWLAGKARLDWLMGSCHSHLGRHTCIRILQLWAVNSDVFICFLKENLDLDLQILCSTSDFQQRNEVCNPPPLPVTHRFTVLSRYLLFAPVTVPPKLSHIRPVFKRFTATSAYNFMYINVQWHGGTTYIKQF
jgi:hypothetical protein